MSKLSDNQAFMLEQNAIESYPWQLFVVPDKTTGIKEQIIDSNGNNPKIQTMSSRQQQAYIGVTDTLPSYIAIIVKEDQLLDLVRSQYEYLISFDDGNTFIKFYADIKESPQPDLYWELILTRKS